MSRESYEKGLKTRRKVLGDEWVDRAINNATPFNAEFQDLITRYVWNETWNRPKLSHRERRLMVVATLVALGHWEEFRLHVRAALDSGDLDIEDIKEILLQCTMYCGVPAGNSGFREARAVIDERASVGRRKNPR
jgi:4-carboxymuconolactone decarboxylase